MNIVAGEGKNSAKFWVVRWREVRGRGGEVWEMGEGVRVREGAGGGRAGEGERVRGTVGGLGDADPFPVDLNTGDKHGSASQFCI